MTLEELAEIRVRQMIERDPDTLEVVNMYRSRNRPWNRILGCFRQHMEELGINPWLDPDQEITSGD